MQFTKITLAASTALTLSMTAVFADSNEAYLLQLGSNHSAIIDQTGGTGNDAGRSDGVVTQRSQFTQLGNTLSIDQDGDNNAIGTGTIVNRGTGVFQFNQSGPGNTATVVQDSSSVAIAAGNEIGKLNQVSRTASASGNMLTVTQNGGDENVITEISQDRSGSVDGTVVGRTGQTAAVTQTGNNNLISIIRQGTQFDASAGNTATIKIIGDDNGLGVLGGLADVGAPNSGAIQSGTSNSLEFMIASGLANQFGFSQTGATNQANGLMISGDRNELGVVQNGSSNTVTLAAITGDDNVIGFTQLGSDNTAEGTILNDGNNNSFGISQNGNTNDASISVDGDDNGATSGGLFGVAALVGGSNGLVAQWGNDNAVSLGIVGSNNAFALEQGSATTVGNNNLITGVVTGNGNAVAVAQLGNGNVSDFAQIGNGNSVGISQ